MAEPITLKGIQRNASKLAVEDGRAEDLINLRFKDGSWRTSGDGMQVFEMTTGNMYDQLYIHTNSPYRHLLGVKEVSGVRKLYWFANISDDAVTVTPLDTPEEICTVADGDLYITQTGHLLTIIDSADDFEYAIFKTGEEKYHIMDVDSNGAQDSRSLYPFGEVHVNYQIDNENKIIETEKHTHKDYGIGGIFEFSEYLIRLMSQEFCRNKMTSLLGQLKSKNKFSSPVYVCVTIKMYDGKHMFGSNPILIYPMQKPNNTNERNFVGYMKNNTGWDSNISELTEGEKHVAIPNADVFRSVPGGVQEEISDVFVGGGTEKPEGYGKIWRNIEYKCVNIPTFSAGVHCSSPSTPVPHINFSAIGYDLCISIDSKAYNLLKSNEDIFKSVCVFITPEISIYDMEDGLFEERWIASNNGYYAYTPHLKPIDKIKIELTNSPFYLLREYSINELSSLQENPIVDLSGPEYAGLLENIVNQPKLDYESQSRTTYIPRVAYNYNGRLHIADYTSIQFHGYPLDCFHLHNHSLKYEEGASFEGLLPNLTSNNDEYYQFQKVKHSLNPSDEVPSVIVRIKLDTSSGEQIVCRYIKGNNYGINNFIEDLNPLITFPDSRATSMKIYWYTGKDMFTGLFKYIIKTFELKQYPYNNLSYYISENLLPISLTDDYEGQLSIDEVNSLLIEVNNNEKSSNGLKVSLTNNPFFFPVEQAYQIGQGRIIAMCSNAIAVGTGQTGAAPLYVFCTDGIYALYVDTSGEMAYTNARIIARDVCNNAKSVTPIDTGVVFTTDRGLMEIAGDVVNEIGQPAEGDVVEYTEPDWAKPRNVGKNMLTKVANLPLNLVDGVDFLSYLTGAIINYNHNERELMVSNPDYPYSYVLDRYSNWSRRDYSADEYVNNYPTSYRVKDGVFYKVDAEQDGLEGKSEAPNDFLYLSNVIKLGSVDFKKAYRFVVRGKFDTNEMRNTSFYSPTSSVVLYDKTQEDNIIKTLVNGKPYTIRPKYDDAYRYIYRLTIYDNNNQEIFSGQTVNGVIEFTVSNWGNVSFISFEKVDSAYPTHEHVISIENTHILGCYVFGSYDGRQFAMLGANEKKGTFTDIGCKIERTDVKYFRVGLAGHLSGDSRIDFMEIDGEQSNLTAKLR